MSVKSIPPKKTCRIFRGAFSLANQPKRCCWGSTSPVIHSIAVRLSSSPNCGHCGWGHTFKRSETDFTSGQGCSWRGVAWQWVFRGWNSFKSDFPTLINQIGVFLFTQFWIQSGLICILCQSYLPWRELNSILIWSHIHISRIFRCTCTTFNELGTPELPKALSRFGATLGRLFIPDPSGSVVGSKESALLVLPFLRELGCPLLVRAHQQPRGIRRIHVRGEKRAVIGEICQGVIVAAGKSQAKSIMPIHCISNAQKTVRLCKYCTAQQRSQVTHLRYGMLQADSRAAFVSQPPECFSWSHGRSDQGKGQDRREVPVGTSNYLWIRQMLGMNRNQMRYLIEHPLYKWRF